MRVCVFFSLSLSESFYIPLPFIHTVLKLHHNATRCGFFLSFLFSVDTSNLNICFFLLHREEFWHDSLPPIVCAWFLGLLPLCCQQESFLGASPESPVHEASLDAGLHALPGGREQAGSGTPEESREGPDSGRMPCLQFPSSNRSSLKRKISRKIAGPKSVSGSVEARSSELNSLNEIFGQVTQASFLTCQVAMMIYLP